MTHSAIRTRVLVLTTEGFEPSPLLRQPQDSQENTSRQLDLSAICFEQFFIQNIDPDRIWMAAGSAAQWDDFNAKRTSHQITLQIILTDTDTVDVFAEVLSADDIVCSDVTRIVNDFERHSNSEAHIVWIHLSTPFQDQGPALQMIRLLQELRSRIEAESSTPCALIVAPLRGNPAQPEPPFQCGFPQLLSQVPLWMDVGDSHVCRVQQLAGSYDLLPTILGFCLPDSSTPHPEDNSEALNLYPWASAPGTLLDRKIRISSDSGVVEVSRILLSVTTTGEENQPSTVYFRKPEDVWNVNPIPLGGEDYNEPG